VTTISTELLPAQFMIFGISEDSDGDLLSDLWEMLVSHTSPTNYDTGSTGIPDGYQDPDGDGWTNLDEMRNGTNPLQFNTPAPPLNVHARFTGTNIIVTWEAARGPVLGYRILDARSGAQIGTVSSNTFSFIDNDLANSIGDPRSDQDEYEIEAIYADGDSESSGSEDIWEPNLTLTAWLVRGQNGQRFLCVGAWPQDAVAVLLTPVTGSPVEIQRTNFTKGVFHVTNIVFDEFTLVQGVGSDGFGTPTQLTVAIEGWPDFINHSFLDLRQVLSDNLRFLVRGANGIQPFSYFSFEHVDGAQPIWSREPTSTEYEYSSFHWFRHDSIPTTVFDPVRPLDENFLWRNFVYEENLFTNHLLNAFSWVTLFLTGAHPYGDTLGNPRSLTNAMFQFDGTVTNSQLSTNQTTWIYDNILMGQPVYCLDEEGNPYVCPNPGLVERGITELYSPYRWKLTNSAKNYFGLPIESMKLVVTKNPIVFDQITSGQSVNVSSYRVNVFVNVQQPIFGANEYYFSTRNPDDLERTFSPPIPSEPAFSPTNTTPLFVTSVGQPIYISGWAKKRILNGDTNKFGFLAQFFDKAFMADTNGNATTNETGILSEYGEFFPTEPVLAILKTKPDIETAEVGEARVFAIKIGLDVNHDGVMDLSFAGPDNTTAQRPFVFWVNDDYDRLHDVQNWLDQDDLANNDREANSPYTPAPTPDCEYRTAGPIAAGRRIIPSTRDLEDFARLWIDGVTSNLLASLPPDAIGELSWGDKANPNSDNPTIDFFNSADPAGGIGYLTNISQALQYPNNLFGYVGRLGPGGSVTVVTNNGAGLDSRESFNLVRRGKRFRDVDADFQAGHEHARLDFGSHRNQGREGVV
jgi:hypothetical protein